MGNRSAFTLRIPGRDIDLPDRGLARQIERTVRDLECFFWEAAAALVLYKVDRDRDGRARRRWGEHSPETLNAQITLATVLANQPEAQEDGQGPLLFHERVTENMLARGEIPREILERYMVIHAKAFVYALSNTGKMLGVFPDPGTKAWAKAEFAAAFPSIVGIRDSTQHPEDRNRGLGKGGKPLALKPINNQMINAPNGALLLDNFINDTFTTTLADGSLGEVDVTEASLAVLRDILEGAFRRLTWRPDRLSGGPLLLPDVVVDGRTLLEEIKRRSL